MALLTALLAAFGPKTTAATDPALPLKVEETETYKLYSIEVPLDGDFRMIPTVSNGVDSVAKLATLAPGTPLAAINAGYFDPKNRMTTSYVTASGKVIADPTINVRFMDNPNLHPYRPAMLNRSELRVLRCDKTKAMRLDIAHHRDALPTGCHIQHLLQAGPDLYAPNAAEKEAFTSTKNGQRLRDPIGVDAKNARSAVGITNHHSVIFAMAAMKPSQGQASGVSLAEMSAIMRNLGATKALSLDGGSSSALWVQGQTYFGKLDGQDKIVQRPVKSALVLYRKTQATP